MKKFLKIFFALLVPFLLVGVVNQVEAGIGFFSSFGSSGHAKGKVVRVNGIGKVTLSPDTALLNVGIETEGETPKEAQESNKELSKKLLDSLGELGIAEKDIQTQWYNIYPNYNYQNPMGRKLLGYNANHTLNVKIRDLEKVTEVMEKVTEAGVTNISNVQYIVENKESAYDQARELAAKNARKKAGKLGAVFGFEVGNIVQVEEIIHDYDMPVPYMGERGGMGGAGGGQQNLVKPGDVEIQLNLNAAFAIIN